MTTFDPKERLVEVHKRVQSLDKTLESLSEQWRILNNEFQELIEQEKVLINFFLLGGMTQEEVMAMAENGANETKQDLP